MGRHKIIFALLGMFCLILTGIAAADMGVPSRTAVDTMLNAGLRGIESEPDVGSTNQGDIQWILEAVDVPGNFEAMSDRSLRIDSSGHLHLVYGGDHLYYAQFDGSRWTTEVVDSNFGVGYGASLDLDSQDQPHISYLGDGKLYYVHRSNNRWIRTIPDERAMGYWSGSTGALGLNDHTAIALDDTDQPHIVYQTRSQHFNLGYIYWTGTTWASEHFPTSGKYPSLALDNLGQPHVTFYTGSEIKYGVLVGGSWSIQTIDNVDSGYGSSLVLDAHGRPHVAYINDVDDALIYAYWTGSQWVKESVSWYSSRGPDVSLALDTLGQPHIALRSRYFKRVNNSWVDSLLANKWTTSPSIVLDDNNFPKISFVTYEVGPYENLGALMTCARWNGSQWVIDDIDPGGDAGYFHALSTNQAGEPSLIYYRPTTASTAEILLAFESGSQWKTEFITQSTFSPSNVWQTAVAHDGQNGIHATFVTGAPYHPPYYGYRDGSGWNLEVITTTRRTRSLSLGVDLANQPHIALTQDVSPGYRLLHGSRSSSGWDILPVENVDFVYTVDLAIGSDGRPHLAYAVSDFAGDRSILKYAVWTGAQWMIQDVEIFTYRAALYEVSLALSSSNFPHIVYSVPLSTTYDDTHLRYAQWTGSTWIYETVDEYEWPIESPTLIIDEIQLPHVAYRKGTVYYARRESGIWVISQVNPTGGYLREVSLAVHDGEPFVSYYEGISHGLILARVAEEKIFLPIVSK